MRIKMEPLPLLLAPLSLASTAAAAGAVAAHGSYWYDWGLYGAYPRQSYESFSSASPWVNILQSDERCDAAYTFIEPRGDSVPYPGPVILDNEGSLVWMETKYGQAMDLKVQKYKGEDYITFWHGGDSGWFGRGYYLMLDSSYNVFKNVTAVGDLDGDLHEFQITDDDTALLTAYEARAADLSAYGVEDGVIWDSVFQEIDLETGELLFQWRASDHYAVTDSFGPYDQYQDAWDFFHINSVDKDPLTGNYLISSRYMCAVAFVSGQTGEVLWQVGGRDNSFTDLSDGHATDFSWQHHARLHREENSKGPDHLLMTVFDNGAYYTKPLRRADHSRGLLVDLDTTAMTATLRHALVSPGDTPFLVPSQGSVNILPDSGNLLVGWGHHPAWTEYDAETGDVLCDTHLGASRLTPWSRVKSYRTYKSAWVGRPETPPAAVLKPDEEAVYVSWNGATEVAGWVVQTAWEDDYDDSEDDTYLDDEDDDDESYYDDADTGLLPARTHLLSFRNATAFIPRATFETRIDLSGAALGTHVQVVAVDASGAQIGCSEVIDARTGLYASGRPLPVPERLGIPGTQLVLYGVVAGIIAGVGMLVACRGVLLRGVARAVAFARGGGRMRGYDVVPQIEMEGGGGGDGGESGVREAVVERQRSTEGLLEEWARRGEQSEGGLSSRAWP